MMPCQKWHLRHLPLLVALVVCCTVLVSSKTHKGSGKGKNMKVVVQFSGRSRGSTAMNSLKGVAIPSLGAGLALSAPPGRGGTKRRTKVKVKKTKRKSKSKKVSKKRRRGSRKAFNFPEVGMGPAELDQMQQEMLSDPESLKELLEDEDSGELDSLLQKLGNLPIIQDPNQGFPPLFPGQPSPNPQYGGYPPQIPYSPPVPPAPYSGNHPYEGPRPPPPEPPYDPSSSYNHRLQYPYHGERYVDTVVIKEDPLHYVYGYQGPYEDEDGFAHYSPYSYPQCYVQGYKDYNPGLLNQCEDYYEMDWNDIPPYAFPSWVPPHYSDYADYGPPEPYVNPGYRYPQYGKVEVPPPAPPPPPPPPPPLPVPPPPPTFPADYGRGSPPGGYGGPPPEARPDYEGSHYPASEYAPPVPGYSTREGATHSHHGPSYIPERPTRNLESGVNIYPAGGAMKQHPIPESRKGSSYVLEESPGPPPYNPDSNYERQMKTTEPYQAPLRPYEQDEPSYKSYADVAVYISQNENKVYLPNKEDYTGSSLLHGTSGTGSNTYNVPEYKDKAYNSPESANKGYPETSGEQFKTPISGTSPAVGYGQDIAAFYVPGTCGSQVKGSNCLEAGYIICDQNGIRIDLRFSQPFQGKAYVHQAPDECLLHSSTALEYHSKNVPLFITRDFCPARMNSYPTSSDGVTSKQGEYDIVIQYDVNQASNEDVKFLTKC